VVGIAGGPAKAKHLLSIGADAVIDYKSENVSKRVAELFPKGIDIYFDNVGGPQLDAALNNLAINAKILLCGQIASYCTGAAK
jgi:NADPH-dependent curcumin reductase CurA